MSWVLESIEKYVKAVEHYEKNHSDELYAVKDNLDTYFTTLCLTNNPQLIHAGWIHYEPKGIVAIDQKGGGKKVREGKKIKLQETRLYVYPFQKTKTLYLLTIGDKRKHNQKRDIQYCIEFVQALAAQN